MNIKLSFARLVSCMLLTGTSSAALAQIIGTIAGGNNGDGGAATSASLDGPRALAVDRAGNRYFWDDNRVRKVTPAGIISTVAGNGGRGYSGDDGSALAASFYDVGGIAIDQAGNLYLADTNNNRVRKVSATTGVVTTIAGNGSQGYRAQSGSALGMPLTLPVGAGLDAAGNLYFVSNFAYVRKLTPEGILSTVAGSGSGTFSGDGGPALQAGMNPQDMSIDESGNVYITDGGARIRKIDTSGIITTIAGNGELSGFGPQVTGLATQVPLFGPRRPTPDAAGNLYFTEANRWIRKRAPNGMLTTIAGINRNGYSGENVNAAATSLTFPTDLAADAAGNLFISDPSAARVFRLSSNGLIRTDAGELPVQGGTVAARSTALYNSSIVVDADGTIYLSESGKGRIRKLARDGLLTTVAGTGIAAGNTSGTGAATSHALYPGSMTIDRAGNLYAASSAQIYKITPGGQISRVAGMAGTGSPPNDGDGGPATSAKLDEVAAIALDSKQNLYILDYVRGRVRKVAQDGIITTVAGNQQGFGGDGGPAIQSSFNNPLGMAIDSLDRIYIADYYNNRIRRIGQDGIVTTIAGTGDYRLTGDDGPATAAGIGFPTSIAFDRQDNLYFVDASSRKVRKVSPANIITAIAGDGRELSAGDGGPAINASFGSYGQLATDRAGDLYLGDSFNHSLRKIQLASYQGVWQGSAAENGWGLSLVQHGSTLAAGWYYYDAARRATWTIMPGCIWNATFTSCTGTLYNATGARFDDYDATRFNQSPVGSMTFTFADADHATLAYTVNGVSGQKTISRLNFASGTAPSFVNYSDIWWGEAQQNGWGVALMQQQGVMVGAWYTYDAQGRPSWFLINGGTWINNFTFEATLTRATGSPLLGTTYNASLFTPTAAGTISFAFSGANNANVTYTVDGVTQTKRISRLQF